jgi:glycosyltransferase involved in cell wall biosynthesis
LSVNTKSVKFQPLVSVVTPVYNSEKYLAECIESVIGQTYDNWEYVIVNNCSEDASLKIANDYAKKDSRIRVHDNNDFFHMVQNHNHSIRQISSDSKYCKVIHADDILFPKCLEEMIYFAEDNPSVGIVGSYVLEGVRVKCDGLPVTSSVFSGRDICNWTLMDKSPVSGGFYVFGSPTSLLILTELMLNRNPFYVDKFIQVPDQEACYYLLQNTDFGFIHQVLTYSRLQPDSTTSSSEILNRRILEEFKLLMEYGPIYLNGKEYNRRLTERLDQYYWFLARSLFEGKGKEFWNFHKDGLKSLGFNLNWGKVVKRMSKKALIRKVFGRFTSSKHFK